jgi:hypothetical protein
MNIPAIAILSAGLVIFLISLPLVYRKVPMNSLYGIRIPAAFESNERWYEINAYGGRQVAIWSWVPIVAGVAGLFVPPKYMPICGVASAPVVLVSMLIPLVKIMAWSRRGASGKRAVAGGQPRTLAEKLRELDELRAQRQVSDAEFEARRRKILGS